MTSITEADVEAIEQVIQAWRERHVSTPVPPVESENIDVLKQIASDVRGRLSGIKADVIAEIRGDMTTLLRDELRQSLIAIESGLHAAINEHMNAIMTVVARVAELAEAMAAIPKRNVDPPKRPVKCRK